MGCPSSYAGDYSGLQVILPSELEACSSPCQSPSSAKSDHDASVNSDCHRKHSQECFYARVHRAWRSWKPPTSLDPRIPHNGSKCPMISCDAEFQDVDTLLTHLETECEGLKSQVNMVHSQSQQFPAPTSISQPTADSGTPQSRCSQCHSTWCWTKSLFGNNKSMKRIRSLCKRRKSSLIPETTVGFDVAASLSVPSSSASYPPPPYSGIQSLNSSHRARLLPELHDAHLTRPVEVQAKHICELGTAPERFELEVPTNPHPSSDLKCDTRGTLSSPSTIMLDDKVWTAATSLNQGSLASFYLPPSISPSSSDSSSLSQNCDPAQLSSQWSSPLTSISSNTDDVDFPTRSFLDNEAGATTMTDVAVRPSAGPTGEFTFDPTVQPPSSNHLGTFLFYSDANERHITNTPTAVSIPPDTMSRSDKTSDFLQPIVPSQPSVPPRCQDFVERLESLKVTFSNLRKSQEVHGINRLWAKLSSHSDAVVLRGGLDTLEQMLQGKGVDEVAFRCCFAYLALAMSIEIKEAVESIEPGFHAALCNDFAQLKKSDGVSELTWRFLDIARFFLGDLESYNPAPRRCLTGTGEAGRYLHEYPLPRHLPIHQGTYTSIPPTLVDHAASHYYVPRASHRDFLTRQGSPDQPTGTLVDHNTAHRLVQQTPQHMDTPANHTPIQQRSSPGHILPAPPNLLVTAGSTASPSPLKRGPKVNRKRQNPVQTSCPPCGFYTNSGPGRQKKLTRHWNTQKHRDIMERLGLSSEATTPSTLSGGGTPSSSGPTTTTTTVATTKTTPPSATTPGYSEERRFRCELLSIDGTPCQKTFTRRDNLKSHTTRIKHLKHNEETGDCVGWI